MDFSWIAIAIGDVTWIALAFVLGMLARFLGLPPLIGFLAAGFVLQSQGVQSGVFLQKIADLGVTLLLFSIGLKLNLRMLARPQVWAVSSIHMIIITATFALLLLGLATAGVTVFSGLDLKTASLVAFALSFSSTVFVVKILEERGEMNSLHGRIAIGVLIVQDIAAVLFLALSTAKLPSIWALLVIAALYPMRPLLFRLMRSTGHGELFILYGFVLALGGAELFELVGMKGDLGALVLGVLVASHPQSDELNKTMLGFKDIFLLGFFLSVGLSGTPTLDLLAASVILVPLVLLKSGLFFVLFTRLRLRARTALYASLNLCNFSEFGLIVAALAASAGLVSYDWVILIAITLSLSFVPAAILNRHNQAIHDRYRAFWRRWQTEERLPYDQPIEINGARVLIVGMGGVGRGACERMAESHPGQVLGVDSDPETVKRHLDNGWNVLRGDPSDRDFWDRVQAAHSVELVMLALPRVTTSVAVIGELLRSGFSGRIVSIARYSEEAVLLREAGAHHVFDIYRQAGSGFANESVQFLEHTTGNHAGL